MTDGTHAKWGHPNWDHYRSIYCGRRAIVTNLDNGVSKEMFIVDAFDDRYLRTPGSIDIMVKSYQEITGDYSRNKQNTFRLKWELKNEYANKYRANGSGDP
jgi:hypothetical protein